MSRCACLGTLCICSDLAASALSTEVRDEPGAACVCYPANETCPSAVVGCCQTGTSGPHGLDYPAAEPIKRANGWDTSEGNGEDVGAAGHVTLESGMVRSDDQGKPDYTLLDLTMLERRAIHMTENVASKGRNNWRLASTEEDLQRFRASAWRHFIAWDRGDTDEDHAAALCFNVDGVEHVRSQL